MKITDELFDIPKEKIEKEFEGSFELARGMHKVAADAGVEARVFFLALTYLMIGTLKSQPQIASDAAVANFIMLVSAVKPPCCKQMSHQLGNAIDVLCTVFDYEDAVSAIASSLALLMAENDDVAGVDTVCEGIKELTPELHANLNQDKQHKH